jgi:hypothetical protein
MKILDCTCHRVLSNHIVLPGLTGGFLFKDIFIFLFIFYFLCHRCRLCGSVGFAYSWSNQSLCSLLGICVQLFVDSVWFAFTAGAQHLSVWHSHLRAVCKYSHAALIDVTCSFQAEK